MARKRRGHRQNRVHRDNTGSVSRASTTASKPVNVTKIGAARVAKQLEQIKATVSTTVVGILFKKRHTQLCIDDDMSKDDAIAHR